jgi:hypothetical protein
MPQVGFEPTTPVFKQTKTVHALDRAATVIGTLESTNWKNVERKLSWPNQILPRNLPGRAANLPKHQ